MKVSKVPLMKFCSRSVSRRGGGGLRAASLDSYAVGCFRYLDEMEIDRERNGISLPIILERGQQSMVTDGTLAIRVGICTSADPPSQGPAPAIIETLVDQANNQSSQPLVDHCEQPWNDSMLSRVRRMSLPLPSAAKWMALRIRV